MLKKRRGRKKFILIDNSAKDRLTKKNAKVLSKLEYPDPSSPSLEPTSKSMTRQREGPKMLKEISLSLEKIQKREANAINKDKIFKLAERMADSKDKKRRRTTHFTNNKNKKQRRKPVLSRKSFKGMGRKMMLSKKALLGPRAKLVMGGSSIGKQQQ